MEYTATATPPSSVLEAFTVETLQETQGCWTLTGYSGRDANVTIPADLSITMLAGNTFRDNQCIWFIAWRRMEFRRA